jgi:hypothetical protein
MGYDISLIGKDGESVQVDQFSEGGVQPVGGSTIADISITYNYSKFFYDTIDKEQGIRWIYGRPAGECIDRLKSAIDVLGTDKDEDYWKPTAGNAGHIIGVLLKWATAYPSCVFRGD